MWCRRSCGTPGYEKSPSVLPPWGFFHKSTVPIIPLKTSHSVSSFAPKGRFGAYKCKHFVNCHHFATIGKMVSAYRFLVLLCFIQVQQHNSQYCEYCNKYQNCHYKRDVRAVTYPEFIEAASNLCFLRKPHSTEQD